MEENFKNKSQQQPDSCINENHKASASKGMLIGMVACAVLGLGGLGFGVYELTQVNSAKRQISDLKVEVKNNDGSTTTLETDKIEVKEDTKTITISDSSIAVDSKEYIYIGEWGIKIKIPDSLVYVDYKLQNEIDDGNNQYVSDYSHIAIQAIPAGTNLSDAKEYYRISRFASETAPCYLAGVARYEKTETDPHGAPVFSDDNYCYYFQSGRTSCVRAEDAGTVLEQIQQNARIEVNNMLSDPKNYSAI